MMTGSKRRGAGLLSLLGFLGSVAIVSAELPPEFDRYQAIINRNAFDLKPPPPPPSNEPPPPPPVVEEEVNINLTGISTRLGIKHVHLMIPAQGTNQARYFNLAVGEKQDSIDVVSIDDKKPEVKIKNAGKLLTLNFETHGMKSGGAAKVAAAGARPGTPPGADNPATAANRAYLNRIQNMRNNGNTAAGTPAATMTTAAAGPTIIRRGGAVANTPDVSGAQAAINNLNGGSAGTGRFSPNVQTTTSGFRTVPNRTIRVPSYDQPPEDQNNGFEVAARQYLQNEVNRQASPNIPIPPLPQLPDLVAPGE